MKLETTEVDVGRASSGRSSGIVKLAKLSRAAS